MKKISFTVALFTLAIAANAQDTYVNAQLTTQADVIGTSRFVGMGGAMGALGADISTIGSNPAGIALIKKYDVSITAGAVWQGKNTASQYGFNPTHATLDQAGFVAAFKTGNDNGLVNFNFGINYQKKIDYNQAFFGAHTTTASWADELKVMSDAKGITEDYDSWGYENTIYGAAYEGCLYRPGALTTGNDATSCASGYLGSYDFNISANISDRYYFGLTFGVDDVRFNQMTDYWEYRNDGVNDFRYVNDQRVRGHGFNLKFGAIVRPFENRSLRVGLAVETPTWYKLTYTDDQTVCTNWNYNTEKALDPATAADPYDNVETVHYSNTDNRLDYKIYSPWKFRFQLGGTIGSKLALGMEYEYAMYDHTSMRYPGNGYWSSFPDTDMNRWTSYIMKGQHSIRLGVEFKPTSNFAIRLGYNGISKVYRDGAYWDPIQTTGTTKYPTSLQYMNLGMTNIITAGVGYRYKWFYADLAYKCRLQDGNYYSFCGDNATAVDLTRHSIVATLGVRF